MAVDPETGLTPKQRIFADAYLATGNGAEAARQAYDITNPDSSTPRTLASQTLAKVNIRKYLHGIAKSVGLTPVRVCTTIVDGMDAQKVAQTATGGTIDLGADHSTRLRAADLGAKLLGLYDSPSEGKQGGGALHLHKHLHSAGQADLEAILEDRPRHTTGRLEASKQGKSGDNE